MHRQANRHIDTHKSPRLTPHAHTHRQHQLHHSQEQQRLVVLVLVLLVCLEGFACWFGQATSERRISIFAHFLLLAIASSPPLLTLSYTPTLRAQLSPQQQQQHLAKPWEEATTWSSGGFSSRNLLSGVFRSPFSTTPICLQACRRLGHRGMKWRR